METFTFTIRYVSITISPSVVFDFIGIHYVIGAYPALAMPTALAAQPLFAPDARSDSEDDSEDEALA